MMNARAWKQRTHKQRRGEEKKTHCQNAVDAATMDFGVKQGRPGNRPGVWVSGMQMLMQLDFLGGNSLILFTSPIIL